MKNFIFICIALFLFVFHKQHAMLQLTQSFESLTLNLYKSHPFLFKLNFKFIGKLTVENLEQINLTINKCNLDINELDKFGRTALHYLVKQQTKNLIPLILALGIEINAQDKDSNTALHLATSCGNTYAVGLLLETQEIDINKRNQYKQTALHIACQLGFEEIVDLLIKRDDLQAPEEDKFQRTILDNIIESPYKNGEKIFEVLLQQSISDCNSANSRGLSPLFNVLTRLQNNQNNENFYYAIIKYLLLCPGLNCNKQDDVGNTALHYAVIQNNEDLVLLFIAHQAFDPNITNEADLSPLMIAIQQGNLKIAQLLLENKRTMIDIIGSRNRLSALCHAYNRKNTEAFNLLIKYGADPHIPMYDHKTIYRELKKKKRSFMKKISSNFFEKDFNQIMFACIEKSQMLFDAIEKKNYQVLKKLAKEQNINKFSQDLYKETPLHKAVRENNKELFVYLISLNYKQLLEKNYEGFTPIKLMLELHHLDLLNYFLKGMFDMLPKEKNTGISEDLQTKIYNMIKALHPDCSLYLWGSRTTEKFSENCPIDIIINKAKSLSFSELDEIKKVLSCMNISYQISVQDFNSMKRGIREKILKEGILWE